MFFKQEFASCTHLDLDREERRLGDDQLGLHSPKRPLVDDADERATDMDQQQPGRNSGSDVLLAHDHRLRQRQRLLFEQRPIVLRVRDVARRSAAERSRSAARRRTRAEIGGVRRIRS